METQNKVEIIDSRKVHNEKLAFNILSLILGISLVLHTLGLILNFLNIETYGVAILASLGGTVNFYLLIVSVFVYALNKNSVNIEALKKLKKVLIASFLVHGISFIIGLYIFATGTW